MLYWNINTVMGGWVLPDFRYFIMLCHGYGCIDCLIIISSLRTSLRSIDVFFSVYYNYCTDLKKVSIDALKQKSQCRVNVL